MIKLREEERIRSSLQLERRRQIQALSDLQFMQISEIGNTANNSLLNGPILQEGSTLQGMPKSNDSVAFLGC
jgi:hypothetical protein